MRRESWFPAFLSLFLLYLLADTFLEDDAYGTVVVYGTLFLSLAVFFTGALGTPRDTAGGPGEPSDHGHGEKVHHS